MNHVAPNGAKGRQMMMQKLRIYSQTQVAMPDTSRRPGDGLDGLYGQNEDISEGLKKNKR